MTYRVEFLPLALSDVEAAVRYISHELGSPQAAQRLAEAIVSTAESLAELPYRHSAYVPPRPLEHEYRSVQCGNYLLLYWVDEAGMTVTVARVVYVRRDLQKAIGE